MTHQAYIRDHQYICPRWRPAEKTYEIIAELQNGYLVVDNYETSPGVNSGGRNTYFIDFKEIYNEKRSSKPGYDSTSDDGEDDLGAWIDNLSRDV